MPMTCQDLLVPGFLHSGPESFDALGKKRHTQQMERRLLVHVYEALRGQRVLETTASSAACPQPARWHLNKFWILVSVSVCWGQALYIGVPQGWHLWALQEREACLCSLLMF